ncbi:MAG: acetyl-CoA carboxylase biotin carboxyl carrier protein subunit [Chloroflexi bacterium]|nr:acetyl-CoA carboxylase biotin carboxyl carrier protein subunit [Chloroflexota bacterium]
MKYTALINDKAYTIEIGANNTVLINGEARSVDFRSIDGTTLFSLLMDNQSWEVLVERTGDEYRVVIDGELHVVDVQDERTRKLAKAEGKTAPATGEVHIKAPMPGLVRGVSVSVGDSVAARQRIVVLEAMKMQNELRSPRAGIVKEVRVQEGEAVNQGQVLVVVK